jgi:lipopolysaccharide/colanic/teichoic acid biosynthesis glycosyltransferase
VRARGCYTPRPHRRPIASRSSSSKRRKLLVDRAYVRGRGFWLDLALLARGVAAVVSR